MVQRMQGMGRRIAPFAQQRVLGRGPGVVAGQQQAGGKRIAGRVPGAARQGQPQRMGRPPVGPLRGQRRRQVGRGEGLRIGVATGGQVPADLLHPLRIRRVGFDLHDARQRAQAMRRQPQRSLAVRQQPAAVVDQHEFQLAQTARGAQLAPHVQQAQQRLVHRRHAHLAV